MKRQKATHMGACLGLVFASAAMGACDSESAEDTSTAAGQGGASSSATGVGGENEGGGGFGSGLGGSGGAAEGGLIAGDVTTITTALPGGDGLVVEADGSLLVSDPGTGTVQRVDPKTGEVTPFASGLSEPYGMSANSTGTIFIADWGALKIKTLSAAGVASDFEDVSSYVGNVFVDSTDNVYIPFFSTGQLDRVTPGGIRTQIAQLPKNEGFHGVLVDDDGRLFVGMYLSGSLYRVDETGDYQPFAQLPGQFGNMLFHRGEIFVTGYDTHQVYRVSEDGEVSVFAGSGEVGAEDGPALSASFKNPNSLAASADGTTLYVTESGGSVRALSLHDG